jgi:hypothetical protein
MGQETLSCKHVQEMGVGWGFWSWATIGANTVKWGKRFACGWSKGLRKCRVRAPQSQEGLGVGKGNCAVVSGLLEWEGELMDGYGLHGRWGGR